MDEIKLVFSSTDLIEKSLTQKLRKLEVISELVQIAEIPNLSQLTECNALLDNLKSNIYLAQFLKAALLDGAKQVHRDLSHGAMGVDPSNYSLEMRILSKVMYITSEKYGLDKMRLGHAGATATNIVLAKVSTVHEFVQNLCSIGLYASIQQFIILQESENDAMAQNQVGRLIVKVLSYLDQSFNQYQLQQTTLADGNLLNLAYLLSERLTDPLTLIELANLIIILAAKLGLENTQLDRFAQWRDELVVLIERKTNQLEALNFAKTYLSRYHVCRLVYDMGREVQGVLHDCIDSWVDYLGEALENIYSLEISTLKKRQQGANQQPYKGLQMFDIFEEKYLNELSQFLQARNKKLFALLMLRSKQSEAASVLIREEVIPKIQGVQTSKLFSSLGLINAEIAKPQLPPADIQEHKFVFKNLLQVSTNWAKAHPEKKSLGQWTHDSLEKLFNQLSSESQHASLTDVKEILSLVNTLSLSTEIPPQSLQELRHKAWSIVLSQDQSQLEKLGNILKDRYNYSDVEFNNTVSYSFIYHLGTHFRGTNIAATQDVFDYLKMIRPECDQVLDHIKRRLDSEDYQFANRKSNQ